MRNLDGSIIIHIGVVVSIAAVIACGTLILLRKFCIRAQPFAVLLKFKMRTMFFAVLMVSVVVFVTLISLYNSVSHRYIKAFLEEVRACAFIQVDNSIMTVEATFQESVSIDSKEKIENLDHVLSGTEYRLAPASGVIDTKDFLYVHTVDPTPDQIHSFKIIGGYVLEISEASRTRRYFSSDRELLPKAREALGVSTGLAVNQSDCPTIRNTRLNEREILVNTDNEGNSPTPERSDDTK